MQTHNQIIIQGSIDLIFKLASTIVDWPTILPHYRWVKILQQEGSQTTAEMAARHLGVPLWWLTIQAVDTSAFSIRYTHIGGITKGMSVEWRFRKLSTDPMPESWLVQIDHDFNPSWLPVIGPWFATRIIGHIFVRQVANKTLNTIKTIVERPT